MNHFSNHCSSTTTWPEQQARGHPAPFQSPGNPGVENMRRESFLLLTGLLRCTYLLTPAPISPAWNIGGPVYNQPEPPRNHNWERLSSTFEPNLHMDGHEPAPPSMYPLAPLFDNGGNIHPDIFVRRTPRTQSKAGSATSNSGPPVQPRRTTPPFEPSPHI